jgi:hypothetical protein
VFSTIVLLFNKSPNKSQCYVTEQKRKLITKTFVFLLLKIDIQNTLVAHNCLLDLEHLVAEKMHSNAYNYNNTDATTKKRHFDSNQYAIRKKFNSKLTLTEN